MNLVEVFFPLSQDILFGNFKSCSHFWILTIISLKYLFGNFCEYPRLNLIITGHYFLIHQKPCCSNKILSPFVDNVLKVISGCEPLIALILRSSFDSLIWKLRLRKLVIFIGFWRQMSLNNKILLTWTLN